MTRNEMLRFISERPELSSQINEYEGQNFTRVKTEVLNDYITDHLNGMPNEITVEAPANNAYKSAVLAFLITLEQKGVLDELLAEIK